MTVEDEIRKVEKDMGLIRNRIFKVIDIIFYRGLLDMFESSDEETPAADFYTLLPAGAYKHLEDPVELYWDNT